MSSEARYGIDGHRYLMGFVATAVVATAAGLIFSYAPMITLGVVTGIVAVLGLQYVLVGKLRHRDRLLGAITWRGDERTLDVGTGGGLLAIGAAKRSPRGQATGIDVWNAQDLSDNTRDRALRNAQVEGVGERVEILDGDARKLPFGNATFHVVVSMLCLHNLDDEGRDKAVREMARVVAPGGTLVISDLKGVGAYATTLRELGFTTVEKGPYWDTFPPQRAVFATRK